MTTYGSTIQAPEPLTDRARAMYRGGVWLVIVAEAMIFVTLFSTRFLLSGTEKLVAPGDLITVAISLALIVSLVPAWLALKSIASANAARMSRYLLMAGILGLVALAAIVADWLTLSFDAGSRFGENYIISTGYHALHIVFGSIWLLAAAAAGRKGRFTRENHWVVEGGVVFWTFVVAMWAALYVVFFIV